jgi:hypothetical protein
MKSVEYWDWGPTLWVVVPVGLQQSTTMEILTIGAIDVEARAGMDSSEIKVNLINYYSRK